MSESPRLDHLNVNGYVESKPRTARGMGYTAIRPVDRQTHGKRLIEDIEAHLRKNRKSETPRILIRYYKPMGPT